MIVPELDQLVLRVLAEKPRHQFDIGQQLRQIAPGLVGAEVNESLARLRAGGLVEHDRHEFLAGWLLSYYRPTADGRVRLDAAAKQSCQRCGSPLAAVHS